jgi:hypothetical protein
MIGYLKDDKNSRVERERGVCEKRRKRGKVE